MGSTQRQRQLTRRRDSVPCLCLACARAFFSPSLRQVLGVLTEGDQSEAEQKGRDLPRQLLIGSLACFVDLLAQLAFAEVDLWQRRGGYGLHPSFFGELERCHVSRLDAAIRVPLELAP